jgi:excisionase family DNA binding protein
MGKERPFMILLTIPETAKEIHVHPCTIRRKITAGEIPFHRIGKKYFFTPQDIEQYLNQCAVPAKTTEAPAGVAE